MRRARRYCNARTTRMPAWVHNRFRDLDERWRSASTGRRTACPTYFAKRLIQQGGAGGFACRSNGHNQWSASKLNKFPRTVMHPARLDGLPDLEVLRLAAHEGRILVSGN